MSDLRKQRIRITTMPSSQPKRKGPPSKKHPSPRHVRPLFVASQAAKSADASHFAYSRESGQGPSELAGVFSRLVEEECCAHDR
jgi:hypothetical protein